MRDAFPHWTLRDYLQLEISELLASWHVRGEVNLSDAAVERLRWTTLETSRAALAFEILAAWDLGR